MLNITNILDDKRSYPVFYSTESTGVSVITKGEEIPIDATMATSKNWLVKDRISVKHIIKIKHILKNGDYTIVLWEDGDKTIIKKIADEPDDPEKALLFALLKKICNNNGAEMRRYFEDAESKTVIKQSKKGKGE